MNGTNTRGAPRDFESPILHGLCRFTLWRVSNIQNKNWTAGVCTMTCTILRGCCLLHIKSSIIAERARRNRVHIGIVKGVQIYECSRNHRVHFNPTETNYKGVEVISKTKILKTTIFEILNWIMSVRKRLPELRNPEFTIRREWAWSLHESRWTNTYNRCSQATQANTF